MALLSLQGLHGQSQQRKGDYGPAAENPGPARDPGFRPTRKGGSRAGPTRRPGRAPRAPAPALRPRRAHLSFLGSRPSGPQTRPDARRGALCKDAPARRPGGGGRHGRPPRLGLGAPLGVRAQVKGKAQRCPPPAGGVASPDSGRAAGPGPSQAPPRPPRWGSRNFPARGSRFPATLQALFAERGNGKGVGARPASNAPPLGGCTLSNSGRPRRPGSPGLIRPLSRGRSRSLGLRSPRAGPGSGAAGSGGVGGQRRERSARGGARRLQVT